jgi:hypothetical protein
VWVYGEDSRSGAKVVAGTFNIVRVAVALPYVGFWVQMRSADKLQKCLMLGVDRTYDGHHETDAFDPGQTSRTAFSLAQHPDRLPRRLNFSPQRFPAL